MQLPLDSLLRDVLTDQTPSVTAATVSQSSSCVSSVSVARAACQLLDPDRPNKYCHVILTQRQRNFDEDGPAVLLVRLATVRRKRSRERALHKGNGNFAVSSIYDWKPDFGVRS